ncbi:adenosylmethionine--8-amino-7-oxononanoate transaminase [Aeromonas schubertii]|uniref:Adenosylmethionine-8-amino-7-oxononanoate aminotransferase n=1 Tax=Aeromonas schubertii TaxID=652 RepID=A0ABS7VBF3_9GAMM|nr:adenosylmethionine--8-amino-7-oxononanoate transaminase [Aeromonas schubertii]MBZ6066276.1 adenosylmethionine--8-amino-7-oxononanoate transaminase [Aeromonas schubertii]
MTSDYFVSEFDLRHIWHPYTSLTRPLPCYEVTEASGVHLTLADGRQLVDGMSSWWACIHGYRVPKLDAAATEQLGRMSHVMFGGITHQPAIRLCQKLVEIAPKGLDRVFLADSGSVAVEVALKMAQQYWHAKGTPRTKFVSLRRGYHGDTFGAMSVCDPDGGMHELYKGFLPEHYFVEAPSCRFHDEWDEQCVVELATLMADHHEEIAAIVLEPIVQGAGGMRFYHPRYLQWVRALCDEFGVLLIADEIATGFGRTGQLFACDWAGIRPDIMCLGKAITGGYLTLSATLTTEQVATTVCEGKAGVFMHGPTFMGNPLACAVACASIELLLDSPWQARVKGIEAQLREELLPLKTHAAVADVRVLGAIGVVELTRPVDVAAIQRRFVELGAWIRPFGKLVYLMPPFVITAQELSVLTGAIATVLEEGGYTV